MAADENNYHFFAEIKSNMSDSELAAFSKAGILELQPGIESLNDHLLQLMGKGNTAVNHVNLLKLGLKHRLMIHWNILCGMPGETKEDYLEMIELIPKLYHLTFPNFSRIVFEKYSRYYLKADEYGLDLVPTKAAHLIYGDDPEILSDMSSDFEVTGKYEHLFEEYGPLYDRVQELIHEWQRAATSKEPAILNFLCLGDAILITDTRPIAKCHIVKLDGLHALLYRLMESPITPESLMTKLSEYDYNEKEISEAIKELDEMALIIYLSGRYLALALPV